MRTTWTGEFACKPEHLWKFLEEPELQKQWMKGLQDSRPTSEGARGLGSTFRMKIKEGSRVAEYDGKVTAYDPPKQLAVVLSGGAFPEGMAINVDYRLTDLGGRTRLDYVAASDCSKPLPWWMKLLMPLFQLFGRMQLKGFMKTLKRLAETPQVA